MLTNLTLEELQTEFLLGFIDSIIVFLIVIFFMQWYAKKKGWDESRSTAFKVSLLWLIINIPFEFFFLYFFGNIIIFILLRIALEIIISMFVIDWQIIEHYIYFIIYVLLIAYLLQSPIKEYFRF